MSQNYGHRAAMFRRDAAWRQSPATAAQKKYIKRLGYLKSRTEEELNVRAHHVLLRYLYTFSPPLGLNEGRGSNCYLTHPSIP